MSARVFTVVVFDVFHGRWKGIVTSADRSKVDGVLLHLKGAGVFFSQVLEFPADDDVEIGKALDALLMPDPTSICSDYGFVLRLWRGVEVDRDQLVAGPSETDVIN